MNEKRKASNSFLWLPVALFVLAAVMIGLSTVGGVRAALSEESENYVGTFEVKNIEVKLSENGNLVGSAPLLQDLLDKDSGEKLELNKTYEEKLAAANTGDIDQYVRAEVYRYWVDSNGEKMTELDPDLIKLTLGSGWYVAESAKDTESGERTVMYYTTAVAPGASTAPFVEAFALDGAIATKVTQTREAVAGGERITTTYDYDGVGFVLEAEVDAVQTHSAEAAIKAAWGVDATIVDGVITQVR